MALMQEVLDTYGAAWNEDDEEARHALLARSLSDDATYCDPTAEVASRAALSDHIGRVRSEFGRFRIQTTSGYEEHHGYVRFTWRMEAENGDLLVEGFDVVRLDSDGRVQNIVGFFGDFPGR